MIGKKYKTRYSGIVPKGIIGKCVDVEVGCLIAYQIKFDNGECFWFMRRDLEAVE